MNVARDALEVAALVEKIRPMLAGKNPGVQGAVLADLMAIYLAGHRDANLREQLFQMHIETVRKLTIVNEQLLSERINVRAATAANGRQSSPSRRKAKAPPR